MIKLRTLKDMDTYNCISVELKESLVEILAILDDNYGTERSDADLGGYAVMLDSQQDIDELQEASKIDLSEDIYEYVEIVGEYAKALYLINSDFAVVVYVKRRIAPKEIIAGL